MNSEAEDRAFLLMSGFRATQMLRVVTELRIPDLVVDASRSAEDLAATAGVKAEPLRRVLRCLVAVGVFTENEDGCFGATPVSDWFRDRPGTLRGTALMLPDESYQAFGGLMQTVRTGEPAFEHVFGMSRWDHLAQNPERAAKFNSSMQFDTERVRDAVASAYDFSRLDSIIDVGGGRGTLIVALLKANPHLRGTVFDLEAGVAESDAYLTQQGVRDRCDIQVGSFFESVPAGHDAYWLKSIVHDWGDEKAGVILANCRKAMSPGARLILVEQVLPAQVEDSMEDRRLFMSDIQMLVMLGGRERTEDEFRTLLNGAGFRLTRSIPTASRFHLIEAVPV